MEASLEKSFWDGLDDFGDKIGKGVYVYKLTVKSPLIDQQVEKYEKTGHPLKITIIFAQN